MINVLFVCIHNSARSQMAEAFLNHMGADVFRAESAGIEPGALNPLVVKVMAEIGYDLASNSVASVFDYFKEGRCYDVVVKVCDQARGQKCPIFPSAKVTLNWSFSDPAELTGAEEEKLAGLRQIRDQIQRKIAAFIEVFET
ncbi:MAG: arsenate reductase ArsC [Bacillota bacterium]|nr:arsenate reductase ArsC [Bacillota bacterium]